MEGNLVRKLSHYVLGNMLSVLCAYLFTSHIAQDKRLAPTVTYSPYVM